MKGNQLFMYVDAESNLVPHKILYNVASRAAIKFSIRKRAQNLDSAR